ncbi:hypothetical protein VaNZ11_001068, partial [Volvox africanus]
MQPEVNLAAEAVTERAILNNGSLAQSHPSEKIARCSTCTTPHSVANAIQPYPPSSETDGRLAQLRQVNDQPCIRGSQLTSNHPPNQIISGAPALVPYGPVTLTMMALLRCRGDAMNTRSNKTSVTDQRAIIHDCTTWRNEEPEVVEAVTGAPFGATQLASTRCCCTSTGPGSSAFQTITLETQTADLLPPSLMNKSQHSQQDYSPHATLKSHHPESPSITTAVNAAVRDPKPPQMDAAPTNDLRTNTPNGPSIPVNVIEVIDLPYAARQGVTTGCSGDGTTMKPYGGLTTPPEGLDVFAAAPAAPGGAIEGELEQQQGSGLGVAMAPDGPCSVQGDPPVPLLPWGMNVTAAPLPRAGD